MPIRKHTIFTGKTFKVPQHIVRLDSARTHGWQLRLGPSKYFADGSNDGRGATAALRLAKAELAKRIARLPAATGLKTSAMANKASGLPLGISGPVARLPSGRKTPYFAMQVSMPLVGGGSTTKSVYIGTENTMTPERVAAALAKAVTLRNTQVRKVKLAATKAKRLDADKAG